MTTGPSQTVSDAFEEHFPDCRVTRELHHNNHYYARVEQGYLETLRFQNERLTAVCRSRNIQGKEPLEVAEIVREVDDVLRAMRELGFDFVGSGDSGDGSTMLRSKSKSNDGPLATTGGGQTLMKESRYVMMLERETSEEELMALLGQIRERIILGFEGAEE